MNARDIRRQVILAGHRGDPATARAQLGHADADVRAAALGALERAGALEPEDVTAAIGDPSPIVRRRAAEAAGRMPGVSLAALLDDGNATVVEIAAWACGEQEQVAVVQHPVQYRAGYDMVSQHLAPFRERLVRGEYR